MVLIAAAVCTKTGKTIMSRQFVEMTKARIEGLLAAFPKLMSTGKQHTFVETDSVRYVYQPLDKLYMLLITTKASNILEDLETLRLFSRVIPEYCRSMEENEIIDNAFNLIFAFDEIVALGYRENVNLAQIRTFVEMDSHEEKVYQAVRKTQEREAKNKMREKAKELQRQKIESLKRGGKPGFNSSSTGFGSSSTFNSASNFGDTSLAQTDIKSSYQQSAVRSQQQQQAAPKAMKLGSKGRDVESFVDQLKNEGEIVQSLSAKGSAAKTGPISAAASTITPQLDNISDVHLRQEEKIEARIGRDGGCQSFELHGLILLRISNEQLGRIRIQLENRSSSSSNAVQVQTHPNIDKELFKGRAQIGLKNPAKPFPLNTDVGVLKWRLQTQDESAIPLTINCWPSENSSTGGCDVNIEYELEHTHLELQDVAIVIPLPVGAVPIITDCDGDYRHDNRKNQLIWSLPIIDKSNKSGAMEFSVPSSIPGDFFPVHVSFKSNTMYATDIKIAEVQMVDDGAPVKHSIETVLCSDSYEVV